MIIHYHCDGKPIGETTFSYTPEAYADWLAAPDHPDRSMAAAVGRASTSQQD